MQGNIYTREKCTQCKTTLKYTKGKGCICPEHYRETGQIARTMYVWFPGKIHVNFQDIDKAEQFLNELRVKKGRDKERFDPEDFRTAKPNAFVTLVPGYLAEKKKLTSYKKIARYLNEASAHFGDRILREIRWGDIRDYVFSIRKQKGGEELSDKTRVNILSQLHDFWMWALEREVITLAEMPAFKKLNCDLGYRKITTWEIQEKVLDQIHKNTFHFNPKVWLAVDMLATYVEIRPDDIRRLRECDYANGYIELLRPTKKKGKKKIIRLCEDHVQLWESLMDDIPSETKFFRHAKTMRNKPAGTPFGINYLHDVWDAAAKEVGLVGVPLYPGTKHTTATETTKLVGRKKSQEASGLTSKAFDRYNQALTDGAFEVVSQIRRAKKADVLPFKKQKEGNE